MAKYDEIMEHIEVSDEMNSRVLKNIEAHFEKEDAPSTPRKEPSAAASRNGSNRIAPKWMVTICVMAALTMLCIYPLMNLFTIHYNMEYQASPQGESSSFKAESIDELSEAVGFTVPEVEGIPFEVIDVRYYGYGDNDSVSIIYIGEADKRLYFDMSRAKERFSGGYLGLEYNKTVKVLSMDVTLEKYSLFEEFYAASWTDADFGYALQITGGNDKASLLRMVESVIRTQQR